MTCSRCQGLMHEDHFYDFEGTQGFMWMKGWRCLNCGHAIDPILEANRRLHESTRPRSTSDEVVSSAASGPEYDTHVNAEAA
jgi:hypothetical protein